MTPYGIYLPKTNELFLYLAQSKVTSDFMVDCLKDFWHSEGTRFPTVTTLVLNQDNGPENHSRRTQFMNRITQFVDQAQLTIQLAYYPPYHSKYNPIERVWGHLEKHQYFGQFFKRVKFGHKTTRFSPIYPSYVNKMRQIG